MFILDSANNLFKMSLLEKITLLQLKNKRMFNKTNYLFFSVFS